MICFKVVLSILKLVIYKKDKITIVLNFQEWENTKYNKNYFEFSFSIDVLAEKIKKRSEHFKIISVFLYPVLSK